MTLLDSPNPLLQFIPNDVQIVCNRLRIHQYKSWIVGGCVRDLLLGKVPQDWDIATNAVPLTVMKIFPKTIPTGIDHGTVTVFLQNKPIEVTTLRGESVYSDGRRPDQVQYVENIEDDLSRRDFTINAMAMDPMDGSIMDPFGGKIDLDAKIIRAVGSPIERFAEDGLRVLRAARFAASLEFLIEPVTFQAMSEERSLNTFRRVSAERIRDEWLKTMKARSPSIAFELMLQTGILRMACPELVSLVGCKQNKHHAFDVWKHSMICVDQCPPEPILRMAALLHDIGKPSTQEFSNKTEDFSFYNHDIMGSKMALTILDRLRFSKDEKSYIFDLIRHHLICYSSDWTDAAVRRWINRVSRPRIEDLMKLSRADIIAKGKADFEIEISKLEELIQRVAALTKSGTAFSMKDLSINGLDLMNHFQLKPGRIIGQILIELFELVLDNPSLNQKEILILKAEELIKKSAKIKAEYE